MEVKQGTCECGHHEGMHNPFYHNERFSNVKMCWARMPKREDADPMYCDCNAFSETFESVIERGREDARLSK